MAEGAPLFESLQLAGWRQFESVDIKFHRRLTVLTGANGAGKSTLLNILSTHLGVSRPYLGVPQRKSGELRFFTGLFKVSERLTQWFGGRKSSVEHFGILKYSNGGVANLIMPEISSVVHGLAIQGQLPVLGFHMPSHRLLPNYATVPNISFGGIKPRDAYQILINENYSFFLGNHTGQSLLFQLKRLLASWATVGEGNSVIEPDHEQMSAYNGFVQVLREILPVELGFKDLIVRPPEILLDTLSGEFLIDAASGGLVTLIEISALIYACSLRDDVRGGPFAVTFDEPENHLHPSLQRSLIPALLKAFPQVQFIVATHSPFMVSSTRDSNVYALRYKSRLEEQSDPGEYRPGARRVETVFLDQANRAGSASEILREVLGVPVTLPLWVEADLERIIEKYQTEPITDNTIIALRADIDASGLSELFTEALARLGSRR